MSAVSPDTTTTAPATDSTATHGGLAQSEHLPTAAPAEGAAPADGDGQLVLGDEGTVSPEGTPAGEEGATKPDTAEASTQGDDAEAAEDAAPDGAPEQYDVPELPEGMAISQGLTDAFAEVCQKYNLPQEAFTELAQFYADTMSTSTREQGEAAEDAALAYRKQMIADTKLDPIVGKRYFKANMQIANDAVNRIFGHRHQDWADEFRAMFRSANLDVHPAGLYFLSQYGKSAGTSEGRMPPNAIAAPTGKPATMAQRLGAGAPARSGD